MVHVPGERREGPGMLLDEPTRNQVFPPASSTTSCLPTPQCPTKRPPSPTCLIPTASPAFQQLGFLPVTYRR